MLQLLLLLSVIVLQHFDMTLLLSIRKASILLSISTVIFFTWIWFSRYQNVSIMNFIGAKDNIQFFRERERAREWKRDNESDFHHYDVAGVADPFFGAQRSVDLHVCWLCRIPEEGVWHCQCSVAHHHSCGCHLPDLPAGQDVSVPHMAVSVLV